MAHPERCVACGSLEFASGDFHGGYLSGARLYLKLHKGRTLIKRSIPVLGYCCMTCGHVHLRANPDEVRQGLHGATT